MELGEAKVLIVDDEPALREIFAKWLLCAGCGEVKTAGDGEEALATLDRERFNLLISDVRMPKMDGITLVRRLAERESTIPSIIFVSGFGDVDEREMYGQGVEAFLSKPLRMAELLLAIQRALAERSVLWLEPMESVPRQTLRIGAEDAAGMRLGRGGFSVRCEQPLTLGKVSFATDGNAGGNELKGQGFVRWRSKSDQRVGVEFSFLDQGSRGWVLEELSKETPRCFLPA